MDKRIKERWLAALRSGDYEQTDGYLHVKADKSSDTFDVSDGYCCLGVLCELAVADGVIQKQRVNGNSFFEYGNPDKDDWDYSVLPVSVREWAGLQDANPYVNALKDGLDPEQYDAWAALSEANDNGSTFAQIADWIERDL